MSAGAAERIWLFADYNQAESRVVAWKGPVPKLRQWYAEGVDVHALVCRSIAKVIQENHIKMPMDLNSGKALFCWKPWAEYGKGDEEREQSKRIVHGSNYDMGFDKLALILGVSEEVAKILGTIYHTLFPEVKSKYQAWIRHCLRTTRTLWMPEPVRFRKVFWDKIDDPKTERAAYATYPQSTVGAMLNRTIRICATIFREDHDEKFKDQWCAWYGAENWDRWRQRRDRGLRDPQTILWSGMDIRLNVHDAGGISIPNDPDLIRWAASTWKQVAETPIHVNEGETMVIPVEFKTGRTWAGEDQSDYKLQAV